MDHNEKRRYLISIDGGGTKTGICVYDCVTDDLRSDVFGGGNYKTHGINTVRDRILNGLREMIPGSDDIPGSAIFLVMGLSGCDSPQDSEVYSGMMQSIGFSPERMYICNDSEMIFRSNADVPGICVVAGTGTISLAFTEDGKTYRAGGWGAPISDEGSGYWIGAEMIRKYLSWIDGTGMYNDFFRKFPAALRCGTDEEAAAALASMNPALVAEWAKPVFESAPENELCRKIIRDAAEMTAVLTESVYRKSGFIACNDICIVESGGLFYNEQYTHDFRQRLFDILPAANYHFLRSDGIPAEDGIRLAKKMAEGPVTTQSRD